MKIAIIGSGISGLAASWLLYKCHDVTIFETDERIGGHANTVGCSGHPAIDTGFIVYNDWTYPNLISLLEHLNVATDKSDMSFSVSLRQGAYEYSSDALFAQKKNIFNPYHWQMLLDILRFYRQAPASQTDHISLEDYLKEHKYHRAFIDNHLVPMAAAIWSAEPAAIKEFPFRNFIRFFDNHGLLISNYNQRPQWYTVKGGSRSYVEVLSAPFRKQIKSGTPVRSIARVSDGALVVNQKGEREKYDCVVLATHSDQALNLLEDPTQKEKEVLGAFPYKTNQAILHQDIRFMPQNKKTWSSWNYLMDPAHTSPFVTYWMNRLQPSIGKEANYFVTINPPFSPDHILYKTDYAHPQFLNSAANGWKELHHIQGKRFTWFCGAWCGYGFHEDGLSAGLAVAEAIGPVARPWKVEETSPAGQNISGKPD